MDRPIYWSTSQLRTVDLLTGARATMTAIAKLSEAVLGTATVVSGLGCGPTSPASLSVQIAPGQIYSLQNLDSTAYSSLPLDNTHQIVKQGVMLDSVALGCPAPGTTGQSINYLIQATFQEVDGGSTVLTYVDSANPNAPWSGPNNSGAANYTIRQDQCIVTVKAGTAATTGSQTTPAPDSGNVGLWVVTVANGQSAITSGNIAVYSGAPVAYPTLPAIPADVQNRTWTYATDTGSANAYVIALAPAVTAYVAGQTFTFKAANSSTGASTLNVNGLGIKSIVRADGSALGAADIVAGQLVTVRFDGVNWQLGGNTGFAASLGTSGYQKLPSGLIVQWGVGTTSGAGVFTGSLPVAFPNTQLVGFASSYGSGSNTLATVSNLNTSTITVNSFTANTGSALAAQVSWLALGK